MGFEEKLQKELRRELDDERYMHTLGVAYTASCLAMRYGETMERAFLAGYCTIVQNQKIWTIKKCCLFVKNMISQLHNMNMTIRFCFMRSLAVLGGRKIRRYG